MRGNTFGKMLSMTTFGESHGEALGAVIDGVPPGLDFSLENLQKELDRRAPGQVAGTTSRREADKAEVLSGIFEGKTLGTPIAVIIRNEGQRSKDYEKWKEEHRPGHADKTTELKYGIRDYRGGGRSSARETVARVICGYFAGLVLKKVKVRAYITKIGLFELENKKLSDLDKDLGPYNFPDSSKWDEIKKYLLDLKGKGNSVGGKIAVVVENPPVGLGEPCFDKLKADFAKAILSIGACYSFSFGLGEEMANVLGNQISSDSSNFGGMEGGMTNGEPIFMQATFKPTSTVGDKAKHGRHDPCVVPRAVPVVEAMVKIVLADHYLRQNAYLNLDLH